MCHVILLGSLMNAISLNSQNSKVESFTINKLNQSGDTTSNRMSQVLMIPGSFQCTILPILLKESSISTSIICPFFSSGLWVLLLFCSFDLFFFRILCQKWMGLLDLNGERKWMSFNWDYPL